MERFELIEEIGKGGIGVVYKAKDTKLNRLVALKVLDLQRDIGEEEIKRFKREAKVIANFKHPNIVAIYDIIEEKNKIYLAMELVEGETLEEKVNREGRLSENKALSIIYKVAKVLQVVHAKGIVHRDIKPSNIMINSDKEIKILDFGTAKWEKESTLTQSNTFIGTVSFTAPEQLNYAKKVDLRADIYSLGATFYYLLTGEPPYKGTMMEVMYQQCFSPPPSLEGVISPSSNKILIKMMQKDPKKRYPNIAYLIEDILKISKHKKYKKDLPLWGYYLVSSKSISKDLLKSLLYIIPTTGEPILDMASSKWCSLDYPLQKKYAKLYQKAYAKYKGLEVEKIFLLNEKIDISMILIPPGRFLMGSSSGETSYKESKNHPVVITKPFWIGKYVVTQKQWKEVVKTKPWKQCSEVMIYKNCPAVYISWLDIKEKFLNRLKDNTFSLPTEAQWEYSCRSGTTTQYFWGDNYKLAIKYAWCAENALNKKEHYAHVVGLKAPNPWGLYDIIGNVWEKCEDIYGEYPDKEVIDPRGPSKGLERVERGGAWDTFAHRCSSSRRSCTKPTNKDATSGFRLVKSIE